MFCIWDYSASYLSFGCGTSQLNLIPNIFILNTISIANSFVHVPIFDFWDFEFLVVWNIQGRWRMDMPGCS
jgi:hypothetical protein